MTNRLALLAAVALAAVTASTAPASPDDAANFLMSRNEVALPGGRRMNLICAGSGKPTIIVESGLGSHMLHWQKAAPRLSAITRICFYDRAGFGFSGASPNPLTARSVTDDLQALLRSAKIAVPVVLVGHSLGGLYATVYANRFPKDVAGLVLIESSFAQQDKGLSPDQHAADAKAFKETVAGLRACAALARSGELAAEPHGECFAFAPNRTDAEKAFLSYQFTRPFRYEAMATEIEAQHSLDGMSDVNSRFEMATRRDYGKSPLVVLTAAMAQNPDDTPEARELATKAWTSWKAGHDRLAARSTIGKAMVVPKTGHFIQIDQPDAVVEAVRKVVGAARQGYPRP